LNAKERRKLMRNQGVSLRPDSDPIAPTIARWVITLAIIALGIALVPAITGLFLMVWFIAKSTVFTGKK
jgi:hypothetical protein